MTFTTYGPQGGRTAYMVEDVRERLAAGITDVVVVVASDAQKADVLARLGHLARHERLRVVTITGTECPARGCGRSIRREMAFCYGDWRRLPADTRQAIWGLYRTAPGSPEHLRALADAVDELG